MARVEVVVAEARAEALDYLDGKAGLGGGDVHLHLPGDARAGDGRRDGVIGEDELQRRIGERLGDRRRRPRCDRPRASALVECVG